ncbi:hypothetical protein LTR09_008571 [Extremus antarcticus]|uniref:Uncharacterized protein n=1 Tax=Extremus antarcticus TaxID=702011 RepID=A0AAJ0DAI9_9PEZI|nr:hypothetical protein LTR09_008571 [Extremus antarcticus]
MGPNPQDNLRRLQDEFEAAGREYVQLSAVSDARIRQHQAEFNLLEHVVRYWTSLRQSPELNSSGVPGLEAREQMKFDRDAAFQEINHLQSIVETASKKDTEALNNTEAAWQKREEAHASALKKTTNDEAKEEGFFRRTSKAYSRYMHRDTRPPSPTYPGKAPRYQSVPLTPDEDTPQTPSTHHRFGLFSLHPPSDEETFRYLAKVKAALADKEHMEQFPDPPAWACGRAKCTETRRDRILDACKHNIQHVFRGKSPKFSCAPWHPDRWGGVKDEVHNRKAVEIFQVLNTQHLKIANPELFSEQQLRDD